MRAHDRAVLHQRVEEDYEQEDSDEYEEEAAEYEEDYEKEDPKSTEEEQEFLKSREKLKDKIRQQLKKERTSAFGHISQPKDKKRTTTNDKFGSFFGPSQPYISPRVIQESRSRRETQHIVAKVPNSCPSSKRDPVSTSVEKKTHVYDRQPKTVNELKKRVQTLKDSRDYSFLLSDDADLPALANDSPPKNVMVPSSVSAHGEYDRFAQAPSQSKILMSNSTRLAKKAVATELDNSVLSNPRMQTKVGLVNKTLLSRPKPSSTESRKMLGSSVGNGHGWPGGLKALPTKVPAQAMGTKKPSAMVINDISSRKTPPSTKHHSSTSKVPIQATGTMKPPSMIINDRSVRKTPSTKPQSSTQNNCSERKMVTEGLRKVKTMPKQSSSSSKVQPSRQIPSHSMHEDRPKKRPAKYLNEEDSDGDEAINMIRQMFRYNPSKYVGVDEDDSDMEVGFDTIQEEELLSSRIGRKEDDEQLRLIEEEERRERSRKEKKRKLNQR